MTLLLKIVAGTIAGSVILYFALVGGLSYYDNQTRKSLLHTVESKLHVGSSKEDMTEFLRQNTSRFALDEQYNHV